MTSCPREPVALHPRPYQTDARIVPPPDMSLLMIIDLLPLNRLAY